MKWWAHWVSAAVQVKPDPDLLRLLDTLPGLAFHSHGKGGHAFNIPIFQQERASRLQCALWEREPRKSLKPMGHEGTQNFTCGGRGWVHHKALSQHWLLQAISSYLLTLWITKTPQERLALVSGNKDNTLYSTDFIIVFLSSREPLFSTDLNSWIAMREETWLRTVWCWSEGWEVTTLWPAEPEPFHIPLWPPSLITCNLLFFFKAQQKCRGCMESSVHTSQLTEIVASPLSIALQ